MAVPDDSLLTKGLNSVCQLLIAHGADVEDMEQEGTPVVIFASLIRDISTMKMKLLFDG